MTTAKWVIQGLFVTLVLLGLCCLTACHQEAPSKPVTEQKLTVEVSPPEQKTIPFFATFPARLEAVDSVEIRARVSGYLWSVDFTPGEDVKKDQVLFHIDARPYQAAVNRIRAELEGCDARLERAKLDLNRAARLVGSKTISQEEYDQYFATKLESQAAVDASKAQLQNAELNLSFTQVTAPLAGSISRNYISVGNLVVADKTLLTTLEADAQMYAYFDVDENSLLQFQELIREGKIEMIGKDQIRIDLLLPPDNSVYPHPGTWNFTDVRMDSGTGTLEFRAEYPNPEVPVKARPSNKGAGTGREERMLIAGMFCRVRVPLGKPRPMLLVPDDAVHTDQGQKFLYLVDKKDKVLYRRVRTGPLYETCRVIEEGLQPDDRVIISGAQRVRPGMIVNPMTPKEMKLK
ncbi:MAG: efflux RND transporter periplasmic adaptor subunit [Pirellulales bacterium]|nr:efflux RND transporter periplasmic adaptor subunit [Pirellulales bacterium]